MAPESRCVVVTFAIADEGTLLRIGLRDDVGLQRRVGGRDAGCRESKFPPHDVGALRDGRRLEERDIAVAALAAEPAVARDDELFRADVLERPPDPRGDLL